MLEQLNSLLLPAVGAASAPSRECDKCHLTVNPCLLPPQCDLTSTIVWTICQ